MKNSDFKKITARLRKSSISMLSYNKLFHILAYPGSEEIFLDAEELASRWRASNKKNKDKIIKLVLYFPYCAQKCLYCRESSEKLGRSTQIKDFLRDARREMRFFAGIFKKKKIDYLTINGGSPDILSADELRKMLKLLFEGFEFAKGAVKRIELNPSGVSAQKLKIMKEFGLNRISLGVQSLTKKALDGAGRPFIGFQKLQETVRLVRTAGLEDINMDLILGLPEEDYSQFEKGLRKVCELQPSQIMIYVLNEPNREYLAKYPQLDLADFQKKVENMVLSFVESSFLDEIKRSNYTLIPGKEHVNYKYFTLVRNDISAISWLSEMDRYINISTLVIGKKGTANILGDLIYERVADFDTTHPIYKAIAVDEEYEMKKFIFSSVESAQKIDMELFRKIFKKDMSDIFGPAINVLRNNGRIILKDGCIFFQHKNSKDILIDIAFFILNMKRQ